MYIKQVSAGSRLRHLHLGSLELPDSKRRRRSARQPDSAKRRSRQAVCPDVYGRHTRCASATEQPVSKYSTLDRCSYAVQSQDPSPEHSRSGMKILPLVVPTCSTILCMHACCKASGGGSLSCPMQVEGQLCSGQHADLGFKRSEQTAHFGSSSGLA